MLIIELSRGLKLFLNTKGHHSCRATNPALHSQPKQPIEVSFSALSPARENDSLYFAGQTGGKQHMPLLTELQKQN